MRSGTLPAPLVIGLGKACEVAQEEMAYDKEHITKLARRLYDGITSQVDEVVLNGPGDLDGPDRYIGNLNLSFAYVEGESLIMGLKVELLIFFFESHNKVSEAHKKCCFLLMTYFSEESAV